MFNKIGGIVMKIFLATVFSMGILTITANAAVSAPKNNGGNIIIAGRSLDLPVSPKRGRRCTPSVFIPGLQNCDKTTRTLMADK